MVRLGIEVGGITLAHPLMNGSGILGSSRQQIAVMCSWGLAALVTKTITQNPRGVSRPPNILYVGELKALINSLGLPNPGAVRIGDLVAEGRRCGLPVIVSVGGSSVEEYVRVASAAEEAGADAVELNLSCPTTPKYGLEVASDPQFVYRAVRDVSAVVRVPVIAKLGVSLRTGLLQLAGKALEGGARALTLINSVEALAVDPENLRLALSSSGMGYSGSPLLYISLKAVYEVYREYRAEVVGCGGITSWRDAASHILVGARALQVVTALMLSRNPRGFVEELLKGLSGWLERKGFRSLVEAVGYIHKA